MPNLDPKVLYEALKTDFPGAQMRLDEPMRRHTTFRIGGPVKAMFLPQSEEEAARLIQLCAQMGISPLVLGNGSNLLCSDGAMDIIVIKMKGIAQTDSMGEGKLRLGAGAMLYSAAQKALELGLGGFEFAHGIPGTVGGGVSMNAGAYGGEMAQRVVSVRAVTAEGELRVYEAGQLDFGYRHSRFEHSGETVLGADIQLYEDDPERVRALMDDLRQRRSDKQPLDRPSAGSAFKRPVGGYAAAMIDGAGLKGFGFGGACVSPKHAGFVVSDGSATCEDVLMTMRAVRDKVLEVYGVELEPEVRFIGVKF